MTIRTLDQVVTSIATSDGAGVKLRRSLGSTQNLRLDPFLMLDEFGTDRAEDYIAGFPSHPHRGFETVTYMLDGHMLHQDHMGNRGDLKSGDVQWMTAARGIIHSEMPQQESGRMRGFQLWINLPAKEKMKPAAYQDIPAAKIPVITLDNGAKVKVIAGALEADGKSTKGPINGEKKISTDPLYFDVELPPNARFEHAVKKDYNAFLYVFEGDAKVGDQNVPRFSAGILSHGDRIEISAGASGARFILLAGKPLREPIVQYGPFVMNTRAEIEQALVDYQNGELASA